MRFYDDRTTVVEWLLALEERGDIATAGDAAYALEKASRWTDAEAQRLVEHWRQEQAA